MFQATHDYLLSKFKSDGTLGHHGTALIGATKMTENGEFVIIISILVVIINIIWSHKIIIAMTLMSRGMGLDGL